MDSDSILGTLIVYGGITFALVFIILSLGFVLSRFYRRCGADEALVRTGSGGNRVVISFCGAATDLRTGRAKPV